LYSALRENTANALMIVCSCLQQSQCRMQFSLRLLLLRPTD